MLNAFTVDVEDYFHPTELAAVAPIERWTALPSRVHVGTELLLEILAAHRVRATFFVLGWIAERSPSLIRNIVQAGHEIACHSYQHRLVYDLSPAAFRDDTIRARSAIEDACGVRPVAYRAPSYSIVSDNLWALEILAECGFTFDSSVFPITHDRYGIPGFGRHAHTIWTSSGPIREIPVATVRLKSGRVAPVGGGAYLRLFSYRYTAAGIRAVNAEGHPACIYLHPWELDVRQPRLARGLISRVRTYTGLETVHKKVCRLLKDFQFSTVSSVYTVTEAHSHREPDMM